MLKPNWVKHSRNPEDEICLRTHDNFVLAVTKVILTMEPSLLIIGDAPIQGCNWDNMISGKLLKELNKLSDQYATPVQLKDFRRRTYRLSDNNPQSQLKPMSDYLIFDLGEESLLEPITVSGQSKFRVTNYDPDRMSSAHAPGVHRYCITNELFLADVIISLPKIKTHQKTGLTGALKNIVGLNGDKDFLPHHRLGGTRFGGDCYPGGSLLRYWSEIMLDKANRRQGKKIFWYWQKFSSLLWRLSLPGNEHNIAAGWHGNDTTWRMVADLNRIAEYGNADGTLSEKPLRKIFSLCDGIIGGQGDGPLEPIPFPLGIVSFTNNSLANDRAMSILMGLPIDKIPLLNSLPYKETECEIQLNNKNIRMEELGQYALKALPPKGWVNYFNAAN